MKAREGRPGQGVFMAAVTVAAVVILVVLKVIGRSTEVNRVRFFPGRAATQLNASLVIAWPER